MHTVVSSVTCHLVGELGRIHRKINLNTGQCLFSSKCTEYGTMPWDFRSAGSLQMLGWLLKVS